jgi:hypothetical protein
MRLARAPQPTNSRGGKHFYFREGWFNIEKVPVRLYSPHARDAHSLVPVL